MAYFQIYISVPLTIHKQNFFNKENCVVRDGSSLISFIQDQYCFLIHTMPNTNIALFFKF